MSVDAGHLVDLPAILARGKLEGFLEETARFYASRLALVDRDFSVIASWNDGGAPPDTSRLFVLECGEGWEGAADGVRPVEVYGTRVGFVVTAPESPEDGTAAFALADHVARLLSELAMKEYELNDLAREILDSYEEVNLFYDISTALGSVRDVDGVCRVILEKACEIIKVNRASILLLDAKTGELHVAASRGIPEEERARIRIPVGVGISGKVLESRTPQLVDDVRRLPSGLLRGYEQYVTRSFISVPLCVDPGGSEEARIGRGADERSWPARSPGRAIGVMNMTDRADRANFTSGDLKLLSALASQAAVLIENIRLIGLEKELRIARNIQQSLLPVAPPSLPGIELAGACIPARNVGGDYYDFLVRPEEGALAAAIADVSGHNVASALMMAVVRSALRSEARETGAPGKILERLNRFLYEDLTRAELFLSMFCVLYEPESRRLRYASAGHNPALLYRPADAGCRALDADGLLTGVLDEMVYKEEEVVLRPGDVLLLYTDGIVEAMDPEREMFGMDRLATALMRLSHLPARTLLDRIFEEVYAFSGERNQADDMTAVVLKVVPPSLR